MIFNTYTKWLTEFSVCFYLKLIVVISFLFFFSYIQLNITGNQQLSILLWFFNTLIFHRNKQIEQIFIQPKIITLIHNNNKNFNTNSFLCGYNTICLWMLISCYYILLKLILVDLYVGRALSWLMFVHKTSKKLWHSSSNEKFERSNAQTHNAHIHTLLIYAQTHRQHRMSWCETTKIQHLNERKQRKSFFLVCHSLKKA